MANISTPRDQNRIPTLMGALNTDGQTPVSITVNPTGNLLSVDDNTTGSDYPTDNAPRDNNRITTLIGVSSTDGVTPVVVYADSTGKLLIDSN